VINASLRILIVDDEPRARERLRDLLECRFHLHVIGEANSVASATALCRDLQPNLVFLDVQMPGGDGFTLLSKIEPLPAVIFVTAYDEFAIRAFEVNAVDYLLKPVNPKRLADALQRIIHAPPATQTGIFTPTDRIFLPGDNTNRVVVVPEISGIKAQGNYTDVLISDGSKVFMRRTISEWESRLPTSLFFCPHRSLIVNMQAVCDLILESRDELKFKLSGHPEVITLGREPGARLRKALRQSRGL